ncbi:MAG: GGDEF domain-containing phosphodiesterase [Lachnospiraceae bacterium]|nr:GGDEF domain-containing phosphodiesterase [Lachnospiraceae bacterium]
MLKSKKAGAGDSAQRHNIPSIVIVGILVFLGILLACFIHVRLIRDNLKDVISDQYGSQLQVAEKAMGDRMKDIEGNIDNASAEIELKMQKKCSDSQITQVLAKYATSDDITNLIFIDRDGIALLDSGEAKDVSSYYDELNAAKDRRFFVSKRGIYGEDGYSLVYLSPVVVNGETEGMVVATQDCKHMIESDAFANMKRIGNIYMLDQDAHILASSYPVDDIHGDYDTIYDFSSAMYHLTNKSVLTMEAALENTATDEEIVFCQDKDGNNYYMAYVMVSGYEDVIVALMYSDDAFNMSESSVIGSTVVTVVIIIALMLLLLVVELLSRARANRMIERFAFDDEITGGKNLNYFKREAVEILRRYKGMAFSVHRFDIANFRYINEAYGHEKADQLLKAITEEAQSIFSSNELCVRMNADQYVLLTKNTLDLEERLFVFIDKVNARALDIGIRYPIKFKRGVYKIQDTSEDISIIIDKANAARKELNGEEKECVAIYSDKMIRDMRKVDKIESSMEQALFNGEFKLFIQPKWDIVENHLYGGEALVRWIRDDGTMVYPSDFIPIFEKNGFIEQLDMFMLESSCQLIRQLVDAGKPVYPISVNQSRVLLHNPQYLDKVKEVMRRYDIPRRSIELEVTETVLFMDQEKMLTIMNNLKSEDIPLSMDDFGSGYSSLNMLKDFPFDVLKIDKEFFSESITSEASILILTKIVEMAHGLGIKVICEGVETKDQVEVLRKIGVRYVQGYYYSRPIPASRFLEQFCELDIFSEESQAKAKANEEKAKELVAAETERSAKIHGDDADAEGVDDSDHADAEGVCDSNNTDVVD